MWIIQSRAKWPLSTGNLNSGITKSHGNKYIISTHCAFLVFEVNLRYMYNFKRPIVDY